MPFITCIHIHPEETTKPSPHIHRWLSWLHGQSTWPVTNKSVVPPHPCFNQVVELVASLSAPQLPESRWFP